LGGTTTFVARGSAPSISDDGQFVAFTSDVDNLVPNDGNGVQDIFIWSAAGGTFQRVTPATGPQHLIQLGQISGDGRFVAYSAQVANASPRNIVFDRVLNTHAEIGSGGLHEPNYISADGRWVAYTQSTSSPLPNDTNGQRDVYLVDRESGITTIASTSPGGGALGDADSEVSGLSADGRYVLFLSYSSNFPGTRAPGSNILDLFFKDMQTGDLRQVNINASGQRVGPPQEAGPGFARPTLSANGRFVVFATTGSNTGADSNGLQDTLLWDRDTAALVRISLPDGGGQAAGGRSGAGMASSDGRYVVFESDAHNLVPGDTNFASDIFLRDAFGAPPCTVTLAPAGLAVVSNSGGNGTINVTAASSCAWTATVNAPWLRTTGIASGVGDGAFSYVFDPYVGGTTIRSGAIVVNTSAYGLRQLGATVTEGPFGVWETPIPAPGGGGSVTGGIALTGWALDDLQVTRIRIYRDPVAGEGSSQIFIGDAVQVAGARPDVAAAYSQYPYNTAAGWGLMVLTNMLPNQGNGTFILHVYYDDAEGHSTHGGTRTIVAANATATTPFGTIDTPAQGQTVSGTVVNFGWALTPQPGTIPSDGSTIDVFIDGVNVGHPSYGHFRSDVATLFPGYANSNGAIGHFTFNSAAYADGVHTIAWVVTDNLGRASGIGSRYFTIQNGTTPVTPPFARGDAPHVSARSSQPILSVRGDEPRWVAPDATGVYEVRVHDLDRIELRLDPWHGPASCGRFTAATLPAGASLDPRSGVLAWQPAAGVGGTHDILVTRTSCAGSREQLTVRVVFDPR
jgi:Tol biopolymer transport system component